MARNDDEEERLRLVALRNAQSILQARRQAEDALRKQTEWLRVTLASIGDAVISTDDEGRVTFMNRVAESLTGWPQAEALGRPLLDVFRIINERSREPVEDPAYRALREGVVVALANHTLLIARDGSERPIDDSAAPMMGETGSPIGTVLVFRDVTERKRAGEASARLAAIVESSDDAIISKTLDGIIQSWNAGAERLFGYTPPEAIGQHITLIIPSEGHQEENAILELLRQGEPVDHFETVRVAKDGRRLDISLTASPIRDAMGHVVGASKIARDITRQRRVERDLFEAERRFRAVFNQQFQFMAILNPDGIVVEANDICFSATGVQRGEVLGRLLWNTPWWKQLPTLQEWWRARVNEVSRGAGPVKGEVEYSQADGSIRHAAVILTSLKDQAGEIVNLIVEARDNTERTKQNEALREADRRKDEFLALLAHELRNPLAPLRNGLQVLRLAADNPQAQAQTRGMMERQLGHMVRLIDDLLDISRISRNKMELRRARVLLADVVSSAVETARPLIEAAGHQLSLTLPPEPVFLDADLTRLAQVFGNLLTNSANYTPHGGHIWLTAARQGGQIVIAVRDNGIGIPAESVQSIFDMFSQVDRSLERSTGGLGIGLALVKGFVEMHSGMVTAESPGVSKGSTFTVRLPVLDDAAQAIPDGPVGEGTHAAGCRRRILVVDDNRDSAMSMAIMLQLLGNEVRTAHDGVEALEVAETFQPGVILMDVGMPRLNGYETTRRVRDRPWGRSTIIIALTGWGQEGDKARSQEAGCNGHLVKPASLPDLEILLGKLAARGSAPM